MTTATPHTLPHGAKGIDFGEAIVAFRSDKVVFSKKGVSHHLTMHIGPDSGVLDIHKTSVRPDGSVCHQTVFSISHANLARFLQELAPLALEALMNVLRPLDLEVLAANRIGVVVGLLTTGAEIEAVTRVRHQKLVVDPNKLAAHATVPEFLDELYALKDGQFFTLFSTRRRQAPRVVGHGFAIERTRGRRELLCLTNRRFAAEMRRLAPLMRTAAMRLGRLHHD